MLIRLLLPTKSFRRKLLNHFISKVVGYMTCFLFDVKFWQMDHVFAEFASAIFCLMLLRMRRNDRSCPSGINIVQNLVLRTRVRTKPKFWPGFEPFWPFLVRMRRNTHTKFQVSIFSRSGDIEGSQNLKVGHVT